MIYLGYKEEQKKEIIFSYIIKNCIKKVFIISPEKFYFDFEYEFIEWNDIIRYTYYYRLLKDIDSNTLIIINECLRIQNRYDLTYNCIRNFLNQTQHQIIFQYLPIIEKKEDFMILFDFDTRSKYKRIKYNKNLFKQINIICNEIKIKLNEIKIKVSYKLKQQYEKKKKELFDNIGLKDPHTIPRNLYLLSGKEKIKHINSFFEMVDNKWYIGRNNRLKINNFQTFKENRYNKKYEIFEFCHNFINFIDFLYLSGQININVFVSDLKIDLWYWERYNNWMREVQNVYSDLY